MVIQRNTISKIVMGSITLLASWFLFILAGHAMNTHKEKRKVDPIYIISILLIAMFLSISALGQLCN